MMHKKKVKGKWQYFKGNDRITEYEYILRTEASEDETALEEDEE